MNGDDYVIDGDLAFSNSKDALRFYQTEYHRQQVEIDALKEAITEINDVTTNVEGVGLDWFYMQTIFDVKYRDLIAKVLK